MLGKDARERSAAIGGRWLCAAGSIPTGWSQPRGQVSFRIRKGSIPTGWSALLADQILQPGQDAPTKKAHLFHYALVGHAGLLEGQVHHAHAAPMV